MSMPPVSRMRAVPRSTGCAPSPIRRSFLTKVPFSAGRLSAARCIRLKMRVGRLPPSPSACLLARPLQYPPQADAIRATEVRLARNAALGHQRRSAPAREPNLLSRGHRVAAVSLANHGGRGGHSAAGCTYLLADL